MFCCLCESRTIGCACAVLMLLLAILALVMTQSGASRCAISCYCIDWHLYSATITIRCALDYF